MNRRDAGYTHDGAKKPGILNMPGFSVIQPRSALFRGAFVFG